MTSFFGGLECVNVKYKSHAPTARELPDNTWVFAGENMAVNCVRHGFLCKYLCLKYG